MDAVTWVEATGRSAARLTTRMRGEVGSVIPSSKLHLEAFEGDDPQVFERSLESDTIPR